MQILTFQSRMYRILAGLGMLIDGPVLLLTLGQLDLNSRDRMLDQWIKFQRRRRQRAARKLWAKTSFRISPNGGFYRTRDGRRVQIRPNYEGWHDKLPFVIFNIGGLQWTVDERGFAYPFDHNFTITPMDIVERV